MESTSRAPRASAPPNSHSLIPSPPPMSDNVPEQCTQQVRRRITAPKRQHDGQCGMTSDSVSSIEATDSDSVSSIEATDFNDVNVAELFTKTSSRTRARVVKQTKDVTVVDEHVKTPPQPGLIRQTWQAAKNVVRFPPITYIIVALVVINIILGLVTLVLGQFERLLCNNIPFVSWFFALVPAICPRPAPAVSISPCTVPLIGTVLQTLGGCHRHGRTPEQQINEWGICNASYIGPPLQKFGFCRSDNSPSKDKGRLDNSVEAAIDGARDINRVKEHADQSWKYGAVMSSGETGVRLLKNRLSASKLEGKQELLVPIEKIGKSLKPISKKTALFRARVGILSDSVNRNLESTWQALQDIERGQTARKGRYRGRLIRHFVDPLHLFHTELARSIGEEEKTVYQEFIHQSKKIRSDVQTLIENAELLEFDLTELQERLLNLDEVRAVNMETVNTKEMELRNRNALVKLWEKISSGEASLKQEEYADNIKLLQRVETYILDNLDEVRRCKMHLDSADAHFRLMKEEYDNTAWSEPDNETLRRIIQRIKSSLINIDEEAKGVYMPESNPAGIEQ